VPGEHFGVERYVGALCVRLDRYFEVSAQAVPSGRAADGAARGDQALVIGIYGQWGAGKTTWLRALEQRVTHEQRARLANTNTTTVLTVPVLFNAWQFEREPHLIVPLLKTAEARVAAALAALAPERPTDEAGFWTWLRSSAQMLGDATVALGAGFRGEFGFGANMKSELLGFETQLGPSAKFNPHTVFDTFAERRRARRNPQQPASPLDAYESMYFELRGYMRSLTGRERRPEALAWLDHAEQRLRDARAEQQAGRVRAARIAELEAELRWLPRWRLVRRAGLRERLLEVERSIVDSERAALGEAANTSANPNNDASADYRLNLLFLIDDLDRCLPEKAVEMLESIKLFLEVPGCAFVLAVDDEMIERGIMHRYRDYRFEDDDGRGHDSLIAPISGAEYLEKIVHLPVRVPPLLAGEIRNFIEREYAQLLDSLDLLAERQGQPSAREPVLDLFERCLPNVPRKVIRAVELYWLLHGLAVELERDDYDPLLLARLALLQLFAPEVYRMGGRRRGRLFLVDLCALKHERLDDVLDKIGAQLELRDVIINNDDSDSDTTPGAEQLRVIRERLKADQMRSLIGAVQRVINSRVDFDPRDVLISGQDYRWRGRVEFHYRLVSADTNLEIGIPVEAEAELANESAAEFLGDALTLELRDAHDDDDALVEEARKEQHDDDFDADEVDSFDEERPSVAPKPAAAPSMPAMPAMDQSSSLAFEPPSPRSAPSGSMSAGPLPEPAREKSAGRWSKFAKQASTPEPVRRVIDRLAAPIEAKRAKVKPHAQPSARPQDLDEFLAFAISSDPADWERALAAEHERLGDRNFDETTFRRLLALAREQPHIFNKDWMAVFGAHLSPQHSLELIAVHRGEQEPSRPQTTAGPRPRKQ
jgi:hypothetical protein